MGMNILFDLHLPRKVPLIFKTSFSGEFWYHTGFLEIILAVGETEADGYKLGEYSVNTKLHLGVKTWTYLQWDKSTKGYLVAKELLY